MESDVGKKSMEILDAADVGKENNKEPDAVLGRDVITEQVQVQEDKHDVMTPAEEKDTEKSNITKPDEVRKSDVGKENNKEPDSVLGRDVITEQVQVQEDKHDVMTPAEEKDTEKSNITKPDEVGKSDVIEVESDVGKKSMVQILDAEDVGKENNKEPDVNTSAVLGKHDVITEQVQVQEDKRDVTTPAEEKDAEKSNITKPDEVRKSDVSEIERRSEKKTNSSDSYDSETEDTTTVISGITNNLTITDNRDVQERPESPTDNLTTTDKQRCPRKA